MKCIDLFSGLGGWTLGAQQAGVNVVWAANHWQTAVDVHSANHPAVAHACQDLHQVDWREVPEHDLLLASPACQGHSRALGDRQGPQHDADRSTAWAVIGAAEVHRPSVIIIENVPDFRRWGLFPVWRQALEVLGYSLSETIVDAAQLGIPQHRPRLFVLGVLGANSPLDIDAPQLQDEELVPVSTIIDWDDPVGWKPIKARKRPLAEATMRQIEHGRRVHGERFIIPYWGWQRREGVSRSAELPVGTLTCRDRYAVVDGSRMRMLSVNEMRTAMGFPSGYVLPRTRRDSTRMLGNAVCPPVGQYVVEQVLRRL